MEISFLVFLAINWIVYTFGFFLGTITMKRRMEEEEWASLSDLAVEVTKIEGKKKSISIAQVKEVMRILFNGLANMPYKKRNFVLNRYKDQTNSKK